MNQCQYFYTFLPVTLLIFLIFQSSLAVLRSGSTKCTRRHYSSREPNHSYTNWHYRRPGVGMLYSRYHYNSLIDRSEQTTRNSVMLIFNRQGVHLRKVVNMLREIGYVRLCKISKSHFQWRFGRVWSCQRNYVNTVQLIGKVQFAVLNWLVSLIKK